MSSPAIFWQARVLDSGFSVWVKKIQFESASAAAGDAFNNIPVFAEGTLSSRQRSFWGFLLLLFAQVNNSILGRSYRSFQIHVVPRRGQGRLASCGV